MLDEIHTTIRARNDDIVKQVVASCYHFDGRKRLLFKITAGPHNKHAIGAFVQEKSRALLYTHGASVCVSLLR